MKDLNQLLLKFDLKQNYKNEDFYVNKSNFFAFNLIDQWPRWEKNILNILCYVQTQFYLFDHAFEQVS